MSTYAVMVKPIFVADTRDVNCYPTRPVFIPCATTDAAEVLAAAIEKASDHAAIACRGQIDVTGRLCWFPL